MTPKTLSRSTISINLAKKSKQIIAVHVTPRSGRDEVTGIKNDSNDQPVVQVRVKAAPEGGKANAVVCAAIAKSIGVSKSSVSVYRGDTARTKLIELDCEEEEVREWMSGLPVKQ